MSEIPQEHEIEIELQAWKDEKPNDPAIKGLETMLEMAQRISELEEANRWRDITKELPENNNRVLTFRIYGFDELIEYCTYNRGEFILEKDGSVLNEDQIKYWQHITKPVEEHKKGN